MLFADNYASSLVYWLDQERQHGHLASLAKQAGDAELEREHNQLASRASAILCQLNRSEINTLAY